MHNVRVVFRWVVRVVLVVCAASAALLTSLISYYIYSTNRTLPSIAEIEAYFDNQQASGTWIDPDTLPRHVTDGFLVTWDPKFYQFRPVCGLLQIPMYMFSDEIPRGTLFGRVARNLILEKEPRLTTWDWHSRAALLECKLQWFTSEVQRRQIFGFLLASQHFGLDIYGMERASDAYFKKSVSALSLAETAYLAAIAHAPSRYLRDPEAGLRRRNAVLDRMAEFGIAPSSAIDQAKADHLATTLQSQSAR